MFNFFKKKAAEIKVIDKVVIDETAKLKAMLDLWNTDNNIIFIFWFDESLDKAAVYFGNQTTAPITLLTAREAATPQITGRIPVFGEHFPLRNKEEELFSKLNLETVQVFSSLREPLFQQFGSDKIIQLMQQLGMKEDEIIEHAMISKAIKRAQEKIENKVTTDLTARSQQDWIDKNYTL